ncbi:hypothetical protein QFZ82_003300 [Streptomyces sp. V4I23]|nr:hypothetical protein [Streptomyces sp. V4I23]
MFSGTQSIPVFANLTHKPNTALATSTIEMPTEIADR